MTLLGAIGDAFFDGSSWNPFAARLLLTGENNSAGGGVWQATPDYPSTIQKLDFLGWAGYEGVQTASDGSVWLVADVGGSKGTTNANARQPNSFVYRFVPQDRTDLTRGGVLQALQVIGTDGQPIVFHAGAADADILSPGMKDLHTYGQWLDTRWVTVHDSGAPGGMNAFDANAGGQGREARHRSSDPRTASSGPAWASPNSPSPRRVTRISTPRPEQPTADSAASSCSSRRTPPPTRAGSAWCSVAIRTTPASTTSPGSQRGRSRPSRTPATPCTPSVDGLDSGFLFSIRQPQPEPERFLAEGRDPSATVDSYLLDSAAPGFPNEGDNEITGIHVSNGDASIGGLLGRQEPHPFSDGWRVFWTQQHGDNVTFEILSDMRDRAG